MHRDSPLLKKARKGKTQKSFQIPRRGRIRLLLLLLVIGLGLWFYKSRKAPQKEGSANQTVTSEKKEKEKEQSKSIKKIKKEKVKKPKRKRPKKLSFKGIEDLMKQFPPSLSGKKERISFRNGAFLIHYSIDSTLQLISKKLFKQYHPKYGATVVIEPATGRVLSLNSYTREGEIPIGKNLYCKNIFPAASIFKAVTAAAVIEKAALTSKSKLRTLGSNHTLYNSQLVKEPKHFREITFGEAFAYSVNPVFGRIGLYLLGSEGLNEYANKFGFNAPIPFELVNDKPVYSYPDTGFTIAEVASGFNQSTSISPLYGAMIAACASNNGKMLAPTIVDSVVDLVLQKKIYERNKRLWRMPVQPETAGELAVLMKKVARYGTARKSFRYMKQSYRFKEAEYGGKTGNVDKDGIGKVDWFIGFCRHKTDRLQHVAVGIVTVHDDNWTVHSSFLGAELMRKYIRNIQIAQKKNVRKVVDPVTNNTDESGNLAEGGQK
jgi:cell division protein FtsI/penicillin-binding protein 2